MPMSKTAGVGAGPTDWSDLPGGEASAAADAEQAVRGGFWRKLQRGAARVPFAEDAVAAYYAAFDRNTPLKVRATLLAALAYFVMPVDALPDVMPLLGFTDDAAVLMAAIRLISTHIGPEHRALARSQIDALRTPPR